MSGNSLRQTVHTHHASVHQAAKLVAALLRVVGVTAGLEESNGSLLPGLWLTSPAGWLPRTGISSGTLHSVIEYKLPLLFYTPVTTSQPPTLAVNMALPAVCQSCSCTAATEQMDRQTDARLLHRPCSAQCVNKQHTELTSRMKPERRRRRTSGVWRPWQCRWFQRGVS